MIAARRSARRLAACIGYSTTVPSAWKLTQLFGKTASGLRGSSESSRDAHGDALAGQRRGEGVEFRLRLRGGLLRAARPLKAIGLRGLRVEAEMSRANHEDGGRALRSAGDDRRTPTLHGRLLHPGRGRHNSLRMSDAVPTLDARSADDARFARDLSAAYEEYGFVIIREPRHRKARHRSLPGLLPAFLRAAGRGQSCRYQMPGGGGARGYTPVRHRDRQGRQAPRSQGVLARRPGAAAGHPFIHATWRLTSGWTAIPGFRESTLSLYESFDALGRAAAGADRAHLGLPSNYFDDKVNLGNSVLRIIHYPPMPPEPTPSVRAGAHEDINVITLLLGAEEPGLEVLSRRGEWLPINPPPGSLVCNVGDMLQRLTNTPAALDHAPRDQSAARTRQQRALLAAVLPALQSGLPHRDAAAVHRRAASRPVSRADHRARFPAGTPARNQADLDSAMAKLYFYYSTMNAGKSTALLQAGHNYEERGMRTLLYTAQIDSRDGGRIHSRIGIEREARHFHPALDLRAEISAEHRRARARLRAGGRIAVPDAAAGEATGRGGRRAQHPGALLRPAHGFSRRALSRAARSCSAGPTTWWRSRPSATAGARPPWWCVSRPTAPPNAKARRSKSAATSATYRCAADIFRKLLRAQRFLPERMRGLRKIRTAHALAEPSARLLLRTHSMRRFSVVTRPSSH